MEQRCSACSPSASSDRGTDSARHGAEERQGPAAFWDRPGLIQAPWPRCWPQNEHRRLGMCSAGGNEILLQRHKRLSAVVPHKSITRVRIDKGSSVHRQCAEFTACKTLCRLLIRGQTNSETTLIPTGWYKLQGASRLVLDSVGSRPPPISVSGLSDLKLCCGLLRSQRWLRRAQVTVAKPGVSVRDRHPPKMHSLSAASKITFRFSKY
ncbi:hypothetical protein Anapl_08145 [Anas platyrhynchos]|uniref:Uncharacterized protein n=1 Tax=Anas platyrhynchos TaxID=8839 RepID=R0M2R5_ANAPL|nr:hypothetical protein Anapl_08145 [Anas platyrhynchos]